MKTLRDAIVTVLNNIKAASGIDTIYYDMPTSVLVSPSVAVLVDGGEESYESTAHDSLTMYITIRVMVEKEDTANNDTTQTSKVLTVGDLILAEFRKKSTMTLSGASYYLVASRIGKLRAGPLENMNVFFQDITVSVKAIQNVTS